MYEFLRGTILSHIALDSTDLAKTKVWLLRVARIMRSRWGRVRKSKII